jgi:aryl-phospho-beta-D-glucosidase BglC (GH1 family)
MKSWNINTVRVPLNEDCWLGINMTSPQYGGPNYQAAVTRYVQDLNAAGLAVILSLQWSAPGSQAAEGQSDMADEDHSPAFWNSVASGFKGDPGVVFDLFNEPHSLPWSCIVLGCTSGGVQYAGYDQLIGAVRASGATNVVMVAGLDWAGDPSGSLTGPGG